MNKPFRKNVALAIDGGGIRGTMVANALAVVEETLPAPLHEAVRLTAGTSTGSIIAGAMAAGMTADKIHAVYEELGYNIFKKSWRCCFPFKYFVHHMYPSDFFRKALQKYVGEATMGDLWDRDPPTDVVITTHDLVLNKTRFVKPWKENYRDWPVWYAVLCSSSAPTYMPVVDGRYVDGGVGSYANPCYLAAYEATRCLPWSAEETTLISIGTGRYPEGLKPHEADKFNALDWAPFTIDTFMSDASDQQVRLVRDFFPALDFRRFQMDLPYAIPMDDASSIPVLTELGEELGRKILENHVDEKVELDAGRPA